LYNTAFLACRIIYISGFLKDFTEDVITIEGVVIRYHVSYM